MAILEGHGHLEGLMDDILVLPWIIIVAMCTTFWKHMLTIFRAQWSSFPSIVNCLTCHPTNIFVPSPTNYPTWPRQQIQPQKENICCACFILVCTHFSILLLLPWQNKGWTNPLAQTKHNKEISMTHQLSPSQGLWKIRE
jgi:hypothetical protein